MGKNAVKSEIMNLLAGSGTRFAGNASEACATDGGIFCRSAAGCQKKGLPTAGALAVTKRYSGRHEQEPREMVRTSTPR